MPIAFDDLICYKRLELDNQTKLKFFLEKHSTKEGTWGFLQLHSGEIDFIFMDGNEKELSRHRTNTDTAKLQIPPAAWHKIEPISDDFAATLEFYCQPYRYFNKKHSLGNPQSDLHYVYNTYLKDAKDLNVLDVGCGQGRNLMFLALFGHQLTGVDIKETSLARINEIADKESMLNARTILHDLHQPLSLQKESYHLVLSLVSLQFLEPDRIHSLLAELQSLTAAKGLHCLVFPIDVEPYSLPPSFTYLAKSKELYEYYQDSGWSILEYKETVGQLHKLDASGKPIQGMFGFLLAQKY